MEIAGVIAVTAADTEAVRADIVESMAAMLRSLQSNIQNVAERQNDMSSSVNATSGSLSDSNGRFKTWMWVSRSRMLPVPEDLTHDGKAVSNYKGVIFIMDESEKIAM